MPIGPAPQRPAEFPFALGDWQIIHAGNAPAHQTMVVDPILVTVTAEPIAAVVVPLVGKAYRNAAFAKCP